mmetsp:Transcript_4576/g.11643  ORF Transcript_4576/g.11643 Transcript_4576/m.11643 type:complete len:103 (+) Transcript_4576:142-450(+)
MRQATISFRVLTLLLCLFVSSSLRYHLFLDAVDTRREYVGHGQAHKDFESLYLAAKDISAGGETKVDGLPPANGHSSCLHNFTQPATRNTQHNTTQLHKSLP